MTQLVPYGARLPHTAGRFDFGDVLGSGWRRGYIADSSARTSAP